MAYIYSYQFDLKKYKVVYYNQYQKKFLMLFLYKKYNFEGIKTFFLERECVKCRKVKLAKELKAKELINFIKEWKD